MTGSSGDGSRTFFFFWGRGFFRDDFSGEGACAVFVLRKDGRGTAGRSSDEEPEGLFGSNEGKRRACGGSRDLDASFSRCNFFLYLLLCVDGDGTAGPALLGPGWDALIAFFDFAEEISSPIALVEGWPGHEVEADEVEAV